MTIINNVWDNKVRFFLSFFIVSFVSYVAFSFADIIPEPAGTTDTVETPAESRATNTSNTPTMQETTTDATPTLLIIDALKKRVIINNPTSTDIASLDASLLTGVTRYPGTADMVQDSTMFLFGHSSHLAYVKNKNFQAFNDIEELVWGDIIRIQSGSQENIYRVDRIYQQKASVASIDIVRDTQTLTLVTCNTFGAKDDRYVVEASLIASHSI